MYLQLITDISVLHTIADISKIIVLLIPVKELQTSAITNVADIRKRGLGVKMACHMNSVPLATLDLTGSDRGKQPFQTYYLKNLSSLI